ncbi:MAG: hypothetical protein EPN91_08675 [Salinibacterium sp.]|nr:MAG: hypothetical protein EPN91_08675 [Salinibacterium sp.]
MTFKVTQQLTEEQAKLVDVAFITHDTNASDLTEVRKLLRALHDKMVKDQPTSKALPNCAAFYRAEISDAIDIINACIIKSRKLTKGELP